jgi:hypothetical protein
MPEKPVTPSSLLEDLSDELEFLAEVVEARGGDLRRLGNVFEKLSTYYRALGICRLSGEGNVDEFFQYLVQSALTRRHYLAGIREGDRDARFRRATFIEPAFDAIAARQWQLASAVLQLTANEWSVGEEYEDDFCYAEFIRRIVTAPSSDVEDLLARWDRVLEGGKDLRLGVARALQARSGTEFEGALTSLLESSERTASKMADPVTGSFLANDETFFPNRWVSVEGLSLLAIAERLGMDARQEFLACPLLARRSTLSGFRSKGYPNIPYTEE